MNQNLFLTSSPFGPLDQSYSVDGIDRHNGFLDRLLEVWPQNASCLLISGFPYDAQGSEEVRNSTEYALKQGGLSVGELDVWYSNYFTDSILRYDVIILGGGHVPSQNAFMKECGLKEKMKDYSGIIIGISAGSMNAAEIVYAQPELPGEAADPDYERFMEGLGLTKANILPHYQMVKDNMLDGMSLFEDITCGDSYGREFLVLPDGSYLMAKDGKETVYGEAYVIRDGILRPYENVE